MKKINSKIVSVSVLKNGQDAGIHGAPDKQQTAPAAVALKPALQMHEGVERPSELTGRTYRIKSPLSEQSIYVCINDIVLNEGTEHEQKRPYEIFLMSKNLEAQQYMTALTRMMSAVFRKGGDVTFIVNELKEVYDPRGGYIIPGGGYMPSIVAEIGVVIERHLSSLGLLRKEALSPEAQALIAEKKRAVGGAMEHASNCPSCTAKAYVIMEGCGTCLECGFSKCS